jgi:hypothetical protein
MAWSGPFPSRDGAPRNGGDHRRHRNADGRSARETEGLAAGNGRSHSLALTDGAGGPSRRRALLAGISLWLPGAAHVAQPARDRRRGLGGGFKLGTLGDLKAEVQHELDHLSDYQHPSGGFGYWPSPWHPDPYITAYTLEVSTLAAREHYRLPAPVIDKAVAWLKIYLSGNQNWAYPYSQSEDYYARAYAVYVLSL